jgi:hypothetical protein
MLECGEETVGQNNWKDWGLTLEIKNSQRDGFMNPVQQSDEYS